MGFIRYVSTGKSAQPVMVNVSMNKGKSWQDKRLLPGQSFSVPKNSTNLLIDNIPYATNMDIEIREGKIIIK